MPKTKNRHDLVQMLEAENKTLWAKIDRIKEKIKANEHAIKRIKERSTAYKHETQVAVNRATIEKRLHDCLVLNGKIPE